MIGSRRIGAIYRKELIEILRDRRTVTAMVIIPVVLYPVIMLAFVQAAESDQQHLREQRFTIAVTDEPTRLELQAILAEAQAALPPTDEKKAEFEVVVLTELPEGLGEHVQLLAGVKVVPSRWSSLSRRIVEVVYNEVSARSRTAREQLLATLDRYRYLQTRQNLGELLGRAATSEGQVDLVLNPIEVLSHSMATERQRGGWALGQIIPIILVLMTITGAIYPAIDLTAGERERGTLETLMVTPVPVLDLIVGKFLVVATVGLIAATLNVVCVGATMHLGGLTRAITTDLPVEFPLTTLPIILLCMVPLALLFAAILVAVCSFARTFKEAQTYTMPVIIAAMIPAIAATLPSVRLEGAMMVLPVGNMVLLTRELFQQTCTWTMVAIVLLSTSLYAAAAVAGAARLFGQEAVLFVDAGSYKTLFCRRLFRPRARPTVSEALLLAALLFPASFYAQSILAAQTGNDVVRTMAGAAVVQFIGLFAVLPAGVATYLKVHVGETFRWKRPPPRAWVAAGLLGLSTWALAHEFLLTQARIITPSPALVESFQRIQEQMAAAPLVLVLMLMAVIPAAGEELLFRGFVLSGLADSLRKWPAIVGASVIFGIFHFYIDRMPVTALLGVLLAWLCWQGGSILPCMLAHALHNAAAVSLACVPQVSQWLRIPAGGGPLGAHLPAHILAPAFAMFLVGLALVASMRRGRE